MSDTPELPGSTDLSEQLYRLYQDVASGAMSMKHGLSIARELSKQADFGEAGLFPMAQGVVAAAREGQIRAASLQWRLVLEALDHAQTDGQRSQIAEGAHAWLYIATSYLFQRPDGRVLADARRRGEQAAAGLLAAGDRAQASAILHSIGVVLIDPYIERRDQQNFAVQTTNWLARGRSNALDLELPGELEMPDPQAALADGAAIFQRAADLRSGRERGQSLKALSDALMWRSVAAGEQPDRTAIAAAMTGAVGLLDPEKDEVAIRILEHNAEALEIELPGRAVAEPDAEELERMRQRDPRGYIHAASMSASRASDPRIAASHLERGLALAAEIIDEDALVDLTLRLVAEGGKLFDIGAIAPGVGGTAEQWTGALQTLRSRATAENWPSSDRALGLLSLAFAASAADREDLATPMLFDPALDLGHTPGMNAALMTGLVQLSSYWGSTHVKAERWRDATAQYLATAGLAGRVGFPGLAGRNFERAMDTLSRMPDTPDASLIAAASRSLPYLQSEVPELADRIGRLWLELISSAAFDDEREGLVTIALPAAKGASLMIARSAQRRRTVTSRPAVEKALANWRAASAAAAQEPPAAYDEEQLLVAYADALERPGNTPADRLENLARRLDRTIASELARGSPDDSDVLVDLDDIRTRLDPDTVLVSIYPCFDDRGKTAYVTVLATDEGVYVRRARGAMPFMDVEIDGISRNDISNAVASVRALLLTDREDGDLNDRLEWAFEYAFGAVEDDLKGLHLLGYRHLCVNPHGALHFCPLPLLGRNGVPLADDWIVTHLPAVGLLAREPDAAAPARTGASAFALSFDDARTGLMPLPAAPDEARRIARAVGSAALIDRDATVERFNEALLKSRWVHAATHGRHDPAAPALQTIYLHSGRRHVLPYFAFDILRHQLDGLDLVTLSACETALGRVDINDNPRGLQAYLFTAGVSTIVSCLWPVGDDVAALFFERLYQALAAGESKLQAFAAAQRTVRARFPRRADWGAFHYSGLW